MYRRLKSHLGYGVGTVGSFHYLSEQSHNYASGNPHAHLHHPRLAAKAARGAERAAEEGKPIEQVIVEYLDEHMPDLDERNFGYTLAKMAERFDLRSGRSDISENFDDVLNGLPLDEDDSA